MTPAEQRSQARASGLLGLVMIAAAVVVLADAAGLDASDDTVGPAAAPTVIGVLLALLGGALTLRARHSLRPARSEREPGRGGSGQTTSEPSPEHHGWWRVAAMVAVLVAFAVLLPLLGYVVSSAGLFTIAALLLGAPHPARVAAYGWTLSVLVFLLFDHVIGLALPAGPWGF